MDEDIAAEVRCVAVALRGRGYLDLANLLRGKMRHLYCATITDEERRRQLTLLEGMVEAGRVVLRT